MKIKNNAILIESAGGKSLKDSVSKKNKWLIRKERTKKSTGWKQGVNTKWITRFSIPSPVLSPLLPMSLYLMIIHLLSFSYCSSSSIPAIILSTFYFPLHDTGGPQQRYIYCHDKPIFTNTGRKTKLRGYEFNKELFFHPSKSRKGHAH